MRNQSNKAVKVTRISRGRERGVPRAAFPLSGKVQKHLTCQIYQHLSSPFAYRERFTYMYMQYKLYIELWISFLNRTHTLSSQKLCSDKSKQTNCKWGESVHLSRTLHKFSPSKKKEIYKIKSSKTLFACTNPVWSQVESRECEVITCYK